VISGAPSLTVDGSGLRVVVVAASWHHTVMSGLIEGARRGLSETGVASYDLVRVPGTFELPVAAARLASHYDAVVALGVVIRGETYHFEIVAGETACLMVDLGDQRAGRVDGPELPHLSLGVHGR